MNAPNRRTRCAVASCVALFLLLGTACSEPEPTLLSAEAPPLEGTTCDELAVEVGEQLDEKMLEIADGAADVNGESQAVRNRAWQVVIFQGLNERLRDLDIRDECETESMFALAETRFSPELKERAGDLLYDRQVGSDETWTYDEWREDALTHLRIIDDE